MARCPRIRQPRNFPLNQRAKENSPGRRAHCHHTGIIRLTGVRDGRIRPARRARQEMKLRLSRGLLFDIVVCLRRDARAAVLGWRWLAYGPVACAFLEAEREGLAGLWSDLGVWLGRTFS